MIADLWIIIKCNYSFTKSAMALHKQLYSLKGTLSSKNQEEILVSQILKDHNYTHKPIFRLILCLVSLFQML